MTESMEAYIQTIMAMLQSISAGHYQDDAGEALPNKA